MCYFWNLKKTQIKLFYTRDWDLTFFADLLALVWPFKKLSPTPWFAKCTSSKVKATRQHCETRPSLGLGMCHCLLCVHTGLKKSLPLPWEVSSFTEWMCWALVSVWPDAALKWDLWFLPKLFNTLFPFYVFIWISVILGWETKSTLKSDCEKFCWPW